MVGATNRMRKRSKRSNDHAMMEAKAAAHTCWRAAVTTELTVLPPLRRRLPRARPREPGVPICERQSQIYPSLGRRGLLRYLLGSGGSRTGPFPGESLSHRAGHTGKHRVSSAARRARGGTSLAPEREALWLLGQGGDEDGLA